VRASGVVLDEHLHAAFTLHTPWGDAPVQLALAGRHQVINALGAAAAGLAIGVPLDEVAAGLRGAQLSAMRMDLTTAPGGYRVLDDAYNASPTSMSAALRAIGELAASRRFAVVGTMAELGDDEADHHRSCAVLAEELGIHLISVDEPWYGVGGADAVADARRSGGPAARAGSGRRRCGAREGQPIGRVGARGALAPRPGRHPPPRLTRPVLAAGLGGCWVLARASVDAERPGWALGEQIGPPGESDGHRSPDGDERLMPDPFDHPAAQDPAEGHHATEAHDPQRHDLAAHRVVEVLLEHGGQRGDDREVHGTQHEDHAVGDGC
jgi:hypothetical protein